MLIIIPHPTKQTNPEMEKWKGAVWRNKGVGSVRMPRIDPSRQVSMM